jgi:integrase
VSYVFQRDGVWYVGWKTVTGAPARKRSPYQTKAEAKKYAAELEIKAERVRDGTDRPVMEAHTWDELCARYLADVVPNLRSNGPVIAVMRKHLSVAFAGRGLREITQGDVMAWATKLRGQKLAESTREQLRIRGSALFTYAAKLQWVHQGQNPFVRSGKRSITKRRPKYLERAEVKALLRVTEGEERNLFAVTVYCGLRRGEVAGLRWEDVDFATGTLNVRHSYTGPTKSGRDRSVQMSDDVLHFLYDQKRRRGDSPFVFPAASGRMRTVDWRASEELQAAFKKAGINRPDFTFRSLRSTLGTHYASQTGDLSATQDMLGHADPATTKDMYAAAIPEHRKKQGQAFSYGLSPGELPALTRGDEREAPSSEEAP